MNRWWKLAALGGCLTSTGCEQRGEPPALGLRSPAPALVLHGPVEHLVEHTAREPMLVESPDGTLYVTGYAAPTPHLWRSTDAGATWTTVTVGGTSEGAIGNSDVDLAVAPDGTLYFVVMSYDREKSEGERISVGVSRDAGETWSWTALSKTRGDDRPWVEVTKDGAAHVIWNDGRGVRYAVSRDSGRTWKEQPRIHTEGGSSHLAVGPGGEIAVRITPVSASGNVEHKAADLIAVSRDGGANWVKHKAPGRRVWLFPFDDNDPLPRWVEPVAWDARDALYSLWTDTSGVWLARSTDFGDQWTTWRIVAGGESPYFPYLTARSAGELAATWFSGRGADIHAHVARIDVPDGAAAPRVVEAQPYLPDSWQWAEKPGTPRHRDTGGEYFPLAFLRDGRLAVVNAIQDDQGSRTGFSWRTVDAR